MTEEELREEESRVTPLCQWEFDHYSPKHWEEHRAGEIKETRSWLEFSDTFDGQRITIYTDTKKVGEIDTLRDQWGTYISVNVEGKGGFTIAQEDGTMSFVDALMAALTKLRNITDIETQPPKFIDLESSADRLWQTPENPPKKRYEIEQIRATLQTLEEFNSHKLQDIELTENGKVIEITPERLEEWKFIGMSNQTFVELEFWNKANEIREVWNANEKETPA